MRKEICIAGFGGQGVVLAGYVLGKALSIYDGYEAVMTQAHGPEARGGASSTNLVVSDETVDYPFVLHPDVLVALSQEAYTKFRPVARPNALILIDSDLVMPPEGDQTLGIPATRLAESIGHRIMANMVMLGFMIAVTGLLDCSPVERAIETSVKAKTVPLNLQAFAAGYEYGMRKEHQS